MKEAVVIKVGGSLLAAPGAPGALRALLLSPRLTPYPSRVVVVGGGEMVDALRRIDVASPLPGDEAHWLAVAAMDLTARVVASWLPGFRLTDDFASLRFARYGDAVLAPGRFLRQVEPGLPGTTLPRGWEVTSDSIAARLAECLAADLVLVKRSHPPEGGPAGENVWKQAAQAGFVDPWFPQAAMGLSTVTVEVVIP